MTIHGHFTRISDGQTLVYNALLPVFRRYYPNDYLPDRLMGFIDALMQEFTPGHVTAITCSLQFTDELAPHDVAEYVVRLRKWADANPTLRYMTGEVRSSNGYQHTMERSPGDVPIFWQDTRFVGLWLIDQQSVTLRIAYLTHT